MYVDIYNTTHRPVQCTNVVPFGFQVTVASKLCHLSYFTQNAVSLQRLCGVGWAGRIITNKRPGFELTAVVPCFKALYCSSNERRFEPSTVRTQVQSVTAPSNGFIQIQPHSTMPQQVVRNPSSGNSANNVFFHWLGPLLECVIFRWHKEYAISKVLLATERSHIASDVLYCVKSYRTLSVEIFVSVWIALPSLPESVGQSLHGSFAVPSSVPVTLRRGDLLRLSLKNRPATKKLN